jgi:predicted amidohydrolase
MQDLTVSLVQADLAWKDQEANLQRFTSVLDGIGDNPELIVLPEMFPTGFVVDPEGYAETMDGHSIGWLREQSKQRSCVITGSVIIREGDGFYNRLIWMRPDGTFSFYDKRHLFSLANEHRKFSKGKERIITELHGWRFLPLICYDLRFPVWSRNRFTGGSYEYDCLVYIANWPSPRNHAWKSLLVGRAIENLSYVIGVNRVGQDGNGQNHTGDSAVVDPMGNALAAIAPGQESVATVRLSAAMLSQTRSKLGFGQDWDEIINW